MSNRGDISRRGLKKKQKEKMKEKKKKGFEIQDVSCLDAQSAFECTWVAVKSDLELRCPGISELSLARKKDMMWKTHCQTSGDIRWTSIGAIETTTDRIDFEAEAEIANDIVAQIFRLQAETGYNVLFFSFLFYFFVLLVQGLSKHPEMASSQDIWTESHSCLNTASDLCGTS